MIEKNRCSQNERYSQMNDIEKEKNGVVGCMNKAYNKNYMLNKTEQDKISITEKKRKTLLENSHLHMKRNGTAVIVDGIEYKSINEASNKLSLSFKFIKRRVNSQCYTNFYFKEECRHDS